MSSFFLKKNTVLLFDQFRNLPNFAQDKTLFLMFRKNPVSNIPHKITIYFTQQRQQQPPSPVLLLLLAVLLGPHRLQVRRQEGQAGDKGPQGQEARVHRREIQ